MKPVCNAEKKHLAPNYKWFKEKITKFYKNQISRARRRYYKKELLNE